MGREKGNHFNITTLGRKCAVGDGLTADRRIAASKFPCIPLSITFVNRSISQVQVVTFVKCGGSV